MNVRKRIDKEFTEKRVEKLAKCLAAVFVIVLSIFVLARKIPETKR